MDVIGHVPLASAVYRTVQSMKRGLGSELRRPDQLIACVARFGWMAGRCPALERDAVWTHVEASGTSVGWQWVTDNVVGVLSAGEVAWLWFLALWVRGRWRGPG